MLSPVQLFETPWTASHQAPLSMEFSRQEYWSGLLFPPLGDLPGPGIESASPVSAGGFLIAAPGKPLDYFQFGPIMNNAAVNVCVQVFV